MLMRSILEKAPFKNYKIYFLGAKEEVVTEMVKRLKREHRDLNITGYHHGYFTSENDREIIEDIRSKCPDILLVAMGTPKQEVWIDDHFEELNVPVVM